MAFTMAVGLFVADPGMYAEYRAEMTPLLEAAGGRFRYDFEVARTLKSEAAHEINRVFLIEFPDRSSKERFFSDPRYLEIRERLFVNSVQGAMLLAECS